MKKNPKILIAGGDMRQAFCAEQLARNYDIYTVGLENAGMPLRAADISDSGSFDCAVLPVPPLTDCGLITAPLGNELPAEKVSSLLRPNALIFTGRPDSRLSAYFPGCPVIDYMSREELCLLNAIPTAEGAVKIALEELPVTLNGLPVLIIGLGRIGVSLAEILKGFGADITAAVRSAAGSAKARILGIRPVCTAELDKTAPKYRLVFNTAPELVLKSQLLEKFSADTLFIDLASRPGGIDFESAAAQNRKVIWALGLPGKTAPVTAGEIVAETISGILAERSDEHE